MNTQPIEALVPPLETRCFKDLEGTIPCKPGDPVALIRGAFPDLVQRSAMHRPIMGPAMKPIFDPELDITMSALDPTPREQ